MNFNQGWVIFIFLGISAISWVYGKMKEKAEAEEAQKRARLHQQRLERMAEGGDAPAAQPPTPAPTTKQQQILARKQQLAQLRQERLAALRAEMAARQQKQQQSRPAQARTAARATPAASRQPSQRPTSPSRTISRQANKPMPSAAPKQRQPSRSAPPASRSGLAQQPHPQRDVEHRTVHRLVADAETTIVTPRQDRASVFTKFSRDDWRKAIIAAEVLGPPVSLRQQT